MDVPSKFGVFAATLVASGTLASANNVGFRGNCEIHQAEPACKFVGREPLHIEQDGPPHYLGTGTATHTGTGTLMARAAAVEGNDSIVAYASAG
jgi:hypothetical protein